jgi:magnesium-protoporphyrin O-methyltransferase
MARHDLRRYRRSGPRKTTRMLLEALEREGVAGATLLDIGGGVGAISNGLLVEGAATATVVDASPAYLQAAREEAERQGHRDRITYRQGDFVEVAADVPSADVVTLDRVICCYDDVDALVSASASRARQLYGLVYPRGSWWDRLGVGVANIACRVRRSPFRSFVHDPAWVDSLIREHGLVRRSFSLTVFWQVVVYARP